MITREEAEVLKHLIATVADADDLIARVTCGWSNKTAKEANAERAEACKRLDAYINNITEK